MTTGEDIAAAGVLYAAAILVVGLLVELLGALWRRVR